MVDVLTLIEKCENYLEIRPLPSAKLLGTLSILLHGPALSWWKAEKRSFMAFMAAFFTKELPHWGLGQIEVVGAAAKTTPERFCL